MRLLRSSLYLCGLAACVAIAFAAVSTVSLFVPSIALHVVDDFIRSPAADIAIALFCVVVLLMLAAVARAMPVVRADHAEAAHPWSISNPATAPPS